MNYPVPPIPTPDGSHSHEPPHHPPHTNPKPAPAELAKRSIGEAVLLFLVGVPLSILLTKLKWNFFMPSPENTSAIESLVNKPAWYIFALLVVAAPLIEETLCRGIPLLLLRVIQRKPRDVQGEYSEAWDRQGALFWFFAIVSSVVFSALHGVGGKSLVLPLPQLFAGFFLWRAAALRGLPYSILLHATYNSLPACLLLLQTALKK